VAINAAGGVFIPCRKYSLMDAVFEILLMLTVAFSAYPGDFRFGNLFYFMPAVMTPLADDIFLRMNALGVMLNIFIAVAA
jgi:hypothetical protein